MTYRYHDVIEAMRGLRWNALTRAELRAVAAAYQHFSRQFCETVEIALGLYPGDEKLVELYDGECNTANLSPYPGVAAEGERMNHDEFMRRAVAMSAMEPAERERVEWIGAEYMNAVRRVGPEIRTMSLPSYEDGGLEKVFTAVLAAPDWDDPGLAAFRHFLVGHIRLDSNPDMGHGALCRHLAVDDRILPLWEAFRDLLVAAAPRLAG